MASLGDKDRIVNEELQKFQGAREDVEFEDISTHLAAYAADAPVAAVVCWKFHRCEQACRGPTTLADIMSGVNLSWFVTWMCTPAPETEDGSEVAERAIRFGLRQFITEKNRASHTGIVQRTQATVNLFRFWRHLKVLGFPVEESYRRRHKTVTPREPTSSSFDFGGLHDIFALSHDRTKVHPLRPYIPDWPFTYSIVGTFLLRILSQLKHPLSVHKQLDDISTLLRGCDCESLLARTDFWIVVCPQAIDTRDRRGMSCFAQRLTTTRRVADRTYLDYSDHESTSGASQDDSSESDPDRDTQLIRLVEEQKHTLEAEAAAKAEAKVQSGAKAEPLQVYGYPANDAQLEALFVKEAGITGLQDTVNRLQEQMEVIRRKAEQQRLNDVSANDSIRKAFIVRGLYLQEYKSRSALPHDKQMEDQTLRGLRRSNQPDRDIQAHSSNFGQDVDVVCRSPEYQTPFRYLYGITFDHALSLCPAAQPNQAVPHDWYEIDRDDKNVVYSALNCYAWLQSIVGGEKGDLDKLFASSPKTLANFPVANPGHYSTTVQLWMDRYGIPPDRHPGQIPRFAAAVIEVVERFAETVTQAVADRKQTTRHPRSSSGSTVLDDQFYTLTTHLPEADRNLLMVFNRAVRDSVWECLKPSTKFHAGPGLTEWQNISNNMTGPK